MIKVEGGSTSSLSEPDRNSGVAAISRLAHLKSMKTVTADARPGPELAQRFSELARQWRQETAAYSVVQKKVLHPAYQRIIGMGPTALPLILQELRREPGHWFWALNAITGDDPAAPGSTFDEAVAAWLNWGRDHGYL